jgi:hypothetical protein
MEHRKKIFSQINGETCERKIKSFSVEDGHVLDVPVESEVRTFSVGAIQMRMKDMRLDSRVRMRNFMMDYKKFFKGPGSKLNPEDFKLLQELFVSDMMYKRYS